jgi:3'(2'), 5'-bisphosphate nucleotidase
MGASRMSVARWLVGSGTVPVRPAATADELLAQRVATEAGELLRALRADHHHLRGWALGDMGDAQANDLIISALMDARPGDAILSEESPDNARRLDADRVWIVDPLDGTKEFREPPRPDWAVHIALWERGKGLTAAAVALPDEGRTPHTGAAEIAVQRPDRPRLVVSRSRSPWGAGEVLHAIGGDLVRLGSAGAKAMAVLHGEAEVYLHNDGLWEWDAAAPAAVAAAAGLHVSDVDGRPLTWNKRDPWVQGFLVCVPELADDVLHALSRL